jgi:hypothetical protein
MNFVQNQINIAVVLMNAVHMFGRYGIYGDMIIFFNI